MAWYCDECVSVNANARNKRAASTHARYRSSRVGNGKGEAKVICNRTTRHEYFGYKSLSFTMAERAQREQRPPRPRTRAEAETEGGTPRVEY
jgi:hypothetical protein